MQNKISNTAAIGDTIVDNMQNMVNLSMGFYRNVFNAMVENSAGMNKTTATLGKVALAPVKAIFNSGDCCPPEQECPPHCMATLQRQAMQGEKILVPFFIRNTCSTPRTYRVGVRELLDQDGKQAPQQPKLNKNSVTLQPNASERVTMTIDLTNFTQGSYATEVVIREKDINQNICFTLVVGDHSAPTVTPRDEKQYKLRWQSWKSHYYCEPGSRKDNT